MPNSFKLSSEDHQALYKIRDSLILESNYLEPDEIRSLGRTLDSVLNGLVRESHSDWESNAQNEKKKAAMAIGMLCQGVEDLSDLASKDRKGVDLEMKRRVAKSGGISNYTQKLKTEGERIIKYLGFTIKEIKVKFD